MNAGRQAGKVWNSEPGRGAQRRVAQLNGEESTARERD